MIVCVVDHNYLDYTKLFLSSLILSAKSPGFRPGIRIAECDFASRREPRSLDRGAPLKNSASSLKHLRYFIFDYSQDKESYRQNCYYAMLQISKLNSSIDMEMIPYEEIIEIYNRFRKLFAVLKIKYFLRTNMMDYLKGYIFRHLNRKPYLFLDNDIIVQGQIDELYGRCEKKGKIVMGRLRNFNLSVFFSYYNHYTGAKLSRRYRAFGPLCSGVLYVCRDYTDAWFDIFSRNISKFGINGHPGLGTWNVLFWLEKGYLLPEKYNCIVDKLKKPRKNTVLFHFPERLKQQMFYYDF